MTAFLVASLVFSFPRIPIFEVTQRTNKYQLPVPIRATRANYNSQYAFKGVIENNSNVIFL